MTAREPDTMDDMDDADASAGEPPEKRIGDRERREVDERLRQAHDDGVLTLGEYDERAAQCWAAGRRSCRHRGRARLRGHRLRGGVRRHRRVVTVDAKGAFGSVDVVRQGERTARGDRDRDDDD